jgi:hypothetical protein
MANNGMVFFAALVLLAVLSNVAYAAMPKAPQAKTQVTQGAPARDEDSCQNGTPYTVQNDTAWSADCHDPWVSYIGRSAVRRMPPS